MTKRILLLLVFAFFFCLISKGQYQNFEKETDRTHLSVMNQEYTAGLSNSTVENGIFTDADHSSMVSNQDCSIGKFLGNKVFLTHRLFEGRGGTSIVTAHDGTVIAFSGNTIRESRNGGMDWSEAREIGFDAGGNAIVNETTGDILLVHHNGYMWKSKDHGKTWLREEILILPNGFGHGAPDGVPLNIGADQTGITLMFGKHKGRLITTARVMGPENSNDNVWRPYHYNTSMYSDDNGKTWQVSTPFPVLGTGEAALAELSDGSIIYNSREHMSDGNRFIAWSYDDGETWLNAYRSPYLPDGPRGSSYGCMGGLIRLPVEGCDILIYSNLDSETGSMPNQVGGSTRSGRENITVWVSFNGGRTWPVKRLVFDGPSAYSNLGVGRPGTPNDGKIYLLYEGGNDNLYEAVNVAVFNLSWLLEGNNSN